jgi:hypothetical protein
MNSGIDPGRRFHRRMARLGVASCAGACLCLLVSCNRGSTAYPYPPEPAVTGPAAFKPTASQLEDERRLVERYEAQIAEIPKNLAAHHQGKMKGGRLRPQHAKMLAGFSQAQIEVPRELPRDLRTGWLQPGSRYRASVRFSNADGIWREDDSKGDLRGIALRIHLSADRHQDFLMTNAPQHHARDAKQALASVAAGGKKGKLSQLFKLGREVGFGEAFRIAGVVRSQKKHAVPNLASETFHSRGCYAVGDVAIRFRLVPERGPSKLNSTPADLGKVMEETLQGSAVRYRLEIQRHRDAKFTPIEQGDAVWEVPGESVPLFILTIPRGATTDPAVDRIRFSPFNLSPDRTIRPIGALNRVRGPVYRRVKAVPVTPRRTE